MGTSCSIQKARVTLQRLLLQTCDTLFRYHTCASNWSTTLHIVYKQEWPVVVGLDRVSSVRLGQDPIHSVSYKVSCVQKIAPRIRLYYVGEATMRMTDSLYLFVHKLYI